MSRPQASPAPTYISTCEARDWPLDSHEKHVSPTPKIPLVIDVDAKAEHLYPSNLPIHTPRLTTHRKHSYIPWLLATFFLLTTLFLAAIVLGVRFFDLTHPVASGHHIHVFLDGRSLQERGSELDEPGRLWSIVTPGVSTGSLYTTTRTTQGLGIPTVIVTGHESRTGRPNTAPTDAPGPGEGEKVKRRDGFITLVK
jgi:hypothetical protein